MPNGDSVALLNVRVVAAPEMNPPATPAAIGSGALCRSGAVELTPTPTSPRRYQPPNGASAGDSGGRDGAGGRSSALAHPHEAAAIAAMARAFSLAMTAIPAFGAGPRRRAPKPGRACHAGLNGLLTLTLSHNRRVTGADFGVRSCGLAG